MAIGEATGIAFLVLPTLYRASVITYHPSFITVTATVTLRISASEHDSSRASADRMLTRVHRDGTTVEGHVNMFFWPFLIFSSVKNKEGWR